MSKPFAPETLHWPSAQTVAKPTTSDSRVWGKAEVQADPPSSEADLALTLLLMTARRSASKEPLSTANWWEAPSAASLEAGLLKGKTLGLVGFSASAIDVARRAHFGFGMKVIFQDAAAVPEASRAEFDAEYEQSVAALLPRCDVVSLHQTDSVMRHVIDGPMLDLMKPDAVLINAAVEQMVNLHALTHALMFDTIGGAGLVLDASKLPASNALTHCETAVVLSRQSTPAPSGPCAV